MKTARSEEAGFFAKTLPIIIGFILFMKIPLVVFIAATLIEIVWLCFQTAFTGTGESLTRSGNVGAATYIIYPFRVLVIIIGRLLWALLLVLLTCVFGSTLVIGVLWLVAAGIAYVVHENPVVYAVIMSELLKAIAIGVSAWIYYGSNRKVGFTAPLGKRVLSKLLKAIEVPSEGTLVLIWFVVVGIAIVVLVFTPILWPFDIQQQFGWPLIQLGQSPS